VAAITLLGQDVSNAFSVVTSAVGSIRDRAGRRLPAMEIALQTAILLFALGAFAAAAYGDVRARHIPNGLPLAIGILGVVKLIPAGDPAPALWTVAAAAAVFAAAVLLWRRGLLGGGDAKLMAAAALLVGHHGVVRFLLVMGFTGGVLAIAVVGAGRLGRPAALLLPAQGGLETPARPSIPYGVAIAAAAALVLIQQYSLMK
jgi:prepilin peptidase CpaA